MRQGMVRYLFLDDRRVLSEVAAVLRSSYVFCSKANTHGKERALFFWSRGNFVSQFFLPVHPQRCQVQEKTKDE